MTYENGKWTIYTTDNTKFEITEEQFNDILHEFLEHADNFNSVWFEKNFTTELPDYQKLAYDFDERIVEVEDIITDIEEDIDAKFYLIPKTYKGDLIE